jgi:iron complex outermembrane receptor protein
MKKSILFILGSFLFSTYMMSQHSISGKIVNGNKEKLVGASVFLKGTKHAVIAEESGNFLLENIPSGTYDLKVSYIGYEDYLESITVEKNIEKRIELSGSMYGLDEIEINATWVEDKQPFSYTNVDKETIEKTNLGQDVPFILKWTPSAVVTSDAGAGVGYTGIRIRGSDPTRINVTINGIPLNDSESQGVFWVDLPDFLASTSQVQIQRGVGTSTNGAGAFGASINLNTSQVHINPYALLNTSAGSFNTYKYSVGLGTGLMNDKFTIDARYSKITSDGYIDRASSDLSSYMFTAAKVSEKSSLRLNIFHGAEVTYQAWNGLPFQLLETDRTFNPSGTEKASEPHENEVDDYKQTHVQLLYNLSINESTRINLAGHYTKGRGFFEQYKASENLIDYGLSENADLASDLIRRRWLDNDFIGLTYALEKSFDLSNFTLGGAYNIYTGRHFGEVIWTEAEVDIPRDHTYYDNDGIKHDFNMYTKLNYGLNEKLYLFGDLQYRRVDYTFLGFNAELENVEQSVSLNFFNPKVGISYLPSKQSRFYTSLAVANREPNRNDYTESSPSSRPDPERLYDLEIGAEYGNSKLTSSTNFYFMNYKDQLVLNGQINDVGAAIRENIESSYRAGVEVMLGYQFTPYLSNKVNFTLSSNKARDYVEFIDSWDTGEQLMIERGTTDLAFSPSTIFANDLEVNLSKLFKLNSDFTFNFLTKYIGEQYIDNTSNENAKLNAYVYNDMLISYALNTKWAQDLRLTLQVNNVFNSLYVANAWVYRFRSEGYDPTPDDAYSRSEGDGNYNLTGLYPQAGRNFLIGLSVKF